MKKILVWWVLLLLSVDSGSVLKENVVGGTPADLTVFKQFAFTIGTLIRDEHGRFYPIHNCGASLIQRRTPALLITAAHCVKPIKGPGGGWTDQRNPNEYWAFSSWTGPGDNVQFSQDSQFRAYRIEQVYFPKQWRLSNQPIFSDVAIVRLDSGDHSDNFYNIPLATLHFIEKLLVSYSNPDWDKGSFQEEITGWGMNGDGDYALTVQSGDVWFINKDDCQKMIAGFKRYLQVGGSLDRFEKKVDQIIQTHLMKLTKYHPALVYDLTHTLYNELRVEQAPIQKRWVFDDETCALDIKEGSSSSCYGDSGGPLVYDNRDSNNRLLTLVGVTSSSVVGTCSTRVPVMYSNLEFYGKWIQSISACIMHSELQKWKAMTDQDWRDEYDYWMKQSEWWNNDGKPGGIPNMVRQAKLDSHAEIRFKKFYVEYMSEHQATMISWCKKSSEIDMQYSLDHLNGLDDIQFSGFFPSMIEFTEWPGQLRAEKYRRAWAKPVVDFGNVRKLSDPKSINNVEFEENIAVSMNITRNTDERIRVLSIPQSILIIKFVSENTLQVSSVDFQCSIVIDDYHDQHNAPGLHLEVVLISNPKQTLEVFINGIRQTQCDPIKGVRWRVSSQPTFKKRVEFGQNIKQNGDVAFNIVVRTWTEPPRA